MSTVPPIMRDPSKLRSAPPLIAASPSSPASGHSPNEDSPAPATPPASSAAAAVRLCVSKKYVLPPRPKPGRKASSELPSNRRKAQNREAQRAFRERRAVAAVEMEERLAEAAQRHASEQEALRRQIEQLTRENSNLKQLRTPDTLYGNSAPSSVSTSSAGPSPSATSPAFMQNVFSNSPGYLVGPSPPATMMHGYSIPSPMQPFSLSPFVATSPGGNHLVNQNVSPPHTAALELLDKVLEQKLPVPNDRRLSASRSSLARTSPEEKIEVPSAVHGKISPRYTPPPAVSPMELVKSDWKAPAVPLRRKGGPLEMDFTRRFPARGKSCTGQINVPRVEKSNKDISALSPLSQSLTMHSLNSPPGIPSLACQPSPDDRCGFCSDGTPCLCAETAARGMTNMSDLETLGGSPITPEVKDGNQKIKEEEMEKEEESKKEYKPGNCDNCQEDPMMALFCTTLSTRPAAKLNGGTFITAQAAYKTLSRHRHFISADFGRVVASLDARGAQVEVNSVARVLRLLDARQL